MHIIPREIHKGMTVRDKANQEVVSSMNFALARTKTPLRLTRPTLTELTAPTIFRSFSSSPKPSYPTTYRTSCAIDC